MLVKSIQLHVVLQQNTQNTNYGLQTCEKTSELFLYRNAFANLGSLAKVSVPV